MVALGPWGAARWIAQGGIGDINLAPTSTSSLPPASLLKIAADACARGLRIRSKLSISSHDLATLLQAKELPIGPPFHAWLPCVANAHETQL